MKKIKSFILAFSLTAFLALSCAVFSQTIKPSQIISLYSDIENGQTFLLKNTKTGIDYLPPAWNVPKGKTFMLTDISAQWDVGAGYTGPTNALISSGQLFVTPTGTTNSINATFFSIGFGQAVNTSFSTPIPIQSEVTISHGLSGAGEVILRGYLSPND
jgi:hypothetical protein